MENRTVNVLFLGGAKRVSFAQKLIAAGREIGVDVNIFSYELALETPIAGIGKVIVGMKWDNPRILENLHSVVKHNDIHIILPFVDPAIGIAGRYARKYPGIFVPVVAPELAEQLFDKALAAQLFKEKGLPIPATYTGGRPRFPLIAKPRHGSASRGIIVINDVPEFRRVLKMPDYMMESYVAQRKEFTVDAYVTAAGDVICVSPRLRVEVLGGEVIKTVTMDVPDVCDLARVSIGALGLRGPVTLQFLRDTHTDELMLMEVNPRLGGGVICSIYAGANIARMILEESLGRPVAPVDEVRPGVLICRYFAETVFNA